MDLEERVKKIETERDQFASSHKTYTELVQKQIDELKEDFKIKRESDRGQINANLEAICWIRKLVLKLNKQKVFFWQLKKEISELKEWNEKAKKTIGRVLSKLFKKVFTLNRNALINTRITKEEIENSTKTFLKILDDSKFDREVLQNHLKSHVAYGLKHGSYKSGEDGNWLSQLQDQIKKLGGEKELVVGNLDRMSKGDRKTMTTTNSKPSEPVYSAFVGLDGQVPYRPKEKEPTEAGSARQTEKPSELCKHPSYYRISNNTHFRCLTCGEKELTEDAEFDCPICNKGVMVGYYLHKGCWEELKADLEWIKKWAKALDPKHDLHRLLEKYIKEKEDADDQ